MNPFQSPLITPAEYYHNAAVCKDTKHRRIVPLAAYRPTLHSSFESFHLPGSKFFNLDLSRDTTSPYPFMLPSPSLFAAAMTTLGIRKDDILVIYDADEIGTYHAPRLAFMCELFGHKDVHVLNNFRQYVRMQLPVGSGPEGIEIPVMGTRGEQGDEYVVEERDFDTGRVTSFEEVRDVIFRRDQEKVRIVDARIPGRFQGVQPEMNPSLRSGHIPGAVNVPLASLLEDETGMILAPEKLRGVLMDAGALAEEDEGVPYILTCNSGVTAASLDLALRLVGAKGSRRVYDGSWMEWTRRVGDELIEVS
ncbi:hypothetical protein AtubIFM55763_005663 [Aspergillus tubingensis]|uniref:Rhodanese domain-containing protein n=2 Tax=Aspergillus subgen. Circumdati TaxID=2720871 RepID=A0A9W6EKQ3_ASPTU|nr:hypothetical protein AtubIFM55763_005663 [Aspergillus tubingensis]GLA82665.1 hypothetical protein AtubIFM56815_006854 [Aspergillus tubingensis]GLB22703.1 hypothetical protein AtubIFM61612_003281 [Aspergillus tubingensis]